MHDEEGGARESPISLKRYYFTTCECGIGMSDKRGSLHHSKAFIKKVGLSLSAKKSLPSPRSFSSSTMPLCSHSFVPDFQNWTVGMTLIPSSSQACCPSSVSTCNHEKLCDDSGDVLNFDRLASSVQSVCMLWTHAGLKQGTLSA